MIEKRPSGRLLPGQLLCARCGIVHSQEPTADPLVRLGEILDERKGTLEVNEGNVKIILDHATLADLHTLTTIVKGMGLGGSGSNIQAGSGGYIQITWFKEADNEA